MTIGGLKHCIAFIAEMVENCSSVAEYEKKYHKWDRTTMVHPLLIEQNVRSVSTITEKMKSSQLTNIVGAKWDMLPAKWRHINMKLK